MDEIDRANALADALHEFRIREARGKACVRELTPTGACHWCMETLDDKQKLYCDSTCASDHAAYKRRGGQRCY